MTTANLSKNLRSLLRDYDDNAPADDSEEARAIVEAVRALLPEPFERGASDTIPAEGAYLVDVVNGHVALGPRAKVAWPAGVSPYSRVTVTEVDWEGRYDRPTFRVACQNGSLSIIPGGSSNAVLISITPDLDESRILATAVGGLHDVSAEAVDDIIEAYVDPEAGRRSHRWPKEGSPC